MTDITLTKLWLDTHFEHLFLDAKRFLEMKIRHNSFGSNAAEMLADYYLIASTNDRLKTRLERNLDGTVTATKPITASGLALYAFNVMFDELDKKARKNLDIARCWDVTTDTDKGILKSLKKHYDSPAHNLFEAACSVSDSGEVVYELCDTSQDQPDANIDRLDDIEITAMIQTLANCSRNVRVSGTVMKDAELSVFACVHGWKTKDLAVAAGCNQGNARTKMNLAQKAIDYWANTHREAHRILTIKTNGGKIGKNSDPVVVELMIKKGMLTNALEITEEGRSFALFPRVPKLFKESLSYYLIDNEEPTGETDTDMLDIKQLPYLYQELMKAKRRHT